MCDAVKQHENVTHELIKALCMMVIDVLFKFLFLFPSAICMFLSSTCNMYERPVSTMSTAK